MKTCTQYSCPQGQFYDTRNIPAGDRLGLLQRIFGVNVVVILLIKGSKKPLQKGAFRDYGARMNDPGYRSQIEDPNYDLAILNGVDGGDIVTLDFDDPEAQQEWETLNSNLLIDGNNMVIGESSRGRKYIFRAKGPYPHKRISFSSNDKHGGDFLGGNCMTKVIGTHESGVPYQLTNNLSIKELSLGELNFPSYFAFPPSPTTTQAYFQIGKNGISLDHREIARGIAYETPIFFDEDFYIWNEVSHCFELATEGAVVNAISGFIENISKQTQEKRLLSRLTKSEIGSIILHLKGVCARPLTSEARTNRCNFFPASNGDLEILTCKLHAPHPDRAVLHRSPVAYEPTVPAINFHDWMRELFPDKADQRAFLLIAAQIILGRNYGKKILAIDGRSNTGKSTLIRLLQALIGCDLFTELRTSHLDGRFEISAYRGKSVLVAMDAPHEFLMGSGTQHLKSLTGGDIKSVEIKNGVGHQQLRGDFNVIICSNSPLSIATHGDPSPYLKRFITLHTNFVPEQPVVDYELCLMREEGSGILNLILAYARELLRAPSPSQIFNLEGKQRDRVLLQLDLPGQVSEFIRERVNLDPASQVKIEDLLEAFMIWIEDKGHLDLADLTPDAFGRAMRTSLHNHFTEGQVQRCHVGSGTDRKRGYRGIRILGK